MIDTEALDRQIGIARSTADRQNSGVYWKRTDGGRMANAATWLEACREEIIDLRISVAKLNIELAKKPVDDRLWEVANHYADTLEKVANMSQFALAILPLPLRGQSSLLLTEAGDKLELEEGGNLSLEE